MKIYKPYKSETKDKLKEINSTHNRTGNVYEYIIDPQDAFPYNPIGFELVLHCINTIDKISRLNHTLQHLGLEAVDTSVFYKVMQNIIEGVPTTDNIMEDYFMKVKELDHYSEGFWMLSDDLFFTPDYDLDFHILGIKLKEKEQEIYSELRFKFLNGMITFEEFAKTATNKNTYAIV